MKSLLLFYWSSKVFENKDRENYGDLLSKFIVEKVSGNEVFFYNAPYKRKSFFKKKYLMAIGSILAHAQKNALVWGSGIISGSDTFKAATFFAVRGPLSRKRVQQQGYSCPEVYGDPALLLPLYYQPEKQEIKSLGIIPHYMDHNMLQNKFEKSDAYIIDLLTDDIFETTDAICSCERIISSSLHGVIVAHAYGIPALWVQFSDNLSGDNVKFKDYFLSVGIEPYTIASYRNIKSVDDFNELWNSYPSLPQAAQIEKLQAGLLDSFPDNYINHSV